MALHHKKRNPTRAASGSLPVDRERHQRSVGEGNRVRSADQVIGIIDKGAATRLRVTITLWRGFDRLEIRDLAVLGAGIITPIGTPIWVPFHKIRELIDVLEAAEAEVRARGLIGGAPCR